MKNFNENQLKALDFSRNLIIEAGAGSGKTTVLLARIMTILEQVEAIELKNIVAITFTNKAADELRNRLSLELKNKFETSDNQKWKRCFFQLQEAQITTFHSFFKSIITKYSYLLNIDPDFTLISEYQKNKSVKEIFRSYSNKMIKENNTEFINLFLVLGKKTFLKLVYQLSNHSSLLERISIKSLNSILEELKLQRDFYFKYIEERINKDTFFKEMLTVLSSTHNNNSKIDWKILQNAAEANHIRYQDLSEFINFFLTKSFSIRKNILKCYKDEQHELLQDFCASLLKIDLMETTNINDSDHEYYSKYTKLTKHINQIIQQFNKKKYSEQLYEFDDIEYFFKVLIDKHPETLVDIKKDFKFFLIDEYQDTNYKQFNTLKPLLLDSKSEEYFGRQSSYFVGDPKQSIYGFRDAEVAVFYSTRELIRKSNIKHNSININFNNELESTPDEKKGVILLNTNYRSEAYLLSFFNDIFSKLLGESYNPFDVEFNSLNEFKESQSNHIECFMNVYDNDEKKSLTHHRQKEYSYIVNKIKELLNNGIRLSEIAILIRSRTNIKTIENELKLNKIPYQSTSENLFISQEISDLYNCLSYFCFNDSLSLFGILKSRLFNLSDEDLHKIFELKRPFLYLNEDIKNYIEKIESDFKKLSTYNFLHELLNKTNFLGYTSTIAKENLFTVIKYITESSEFSDNIYETVNILRSKIESEAKFKDEDSKSNDNTNKVKIMTIHASKGLQFPIVFLPDLNNQSKANKDTFFKYQDSFYLPSLSDSKSFVDRFYRHMQQLKDKAEENRILYVAMTRSESRLFLSSTTEVKDDNLKIHRNSILENLSQLFPISSSIHKREKYQFNYIYSFDNVDTDEENLNDEQSTSSPIKYVINESREKLKFSPTKLTVFDNPQSKNEYFNKYILRLFEQSGIKIKKTNQPKMPELINNEIKLNTSASNAIVFGELIHEIFENSLLDKDFNYIKLIKYLISKPKYKPLKINEEDVYKYVTNILNSKSIQEVTTSLIKKSEVSIQHIDKDLILEGKIDLLYNLNEEYFVLDYKTNQVKDRKECEMLIKNKYLIQSKFYALLISKLYPDQRSYTINFLFTTINEIIGTVYTNEEIKSIKSELSEMIDKIYEFEYQF